MTQEQIIEGNKLIAEFMESTYGEGRYFHESSEYCFEACELEYHFSWDWLMPVVEKIESIVFDENNSFNVTIGSTTYCVIQDANGECYDMVYDGEESKLLVVYKAIVEFIKWWNENN